MKIVTPIGFRDILNDEAIAREQIERRVQDLFAEHGFAPIETPTLEVMDVMRAGGRLPSSPFKFFDSQGDLLAMRPDVTLQVARACATRLQDGVQIPARRFRYTQRVFREIQGSKQASPREITQIGVECIGEDGAESGAKNGSETRYETGVKTDTEIIQLFIQALQTAGVQEITLSLATVAPLRELLERAHAPKDWCDAVLAAYHTSDFVQLVRLTTLDTCADFDTSQIAPTYAKAIRELFCIRGEDEAIDEARALVSPLGCAGALDVLEKTFKALPQNSNIHTLIDFSALSSFDYYTGVVFEAYSPYLGTSLGSGGRYDNMMATYGKPCPAAGFAFSLEQILAALAKEESPATEGEKPLRIAVPKGALNKDAVRVLETAGLSVENLRECGRQLVIHVPAMPSKNLPAIDYIIVRPSDAPAFVASGAADCGICGRDSLLESNAQVVQLVDLGFGECRFVEAQPKGSAQAVDERYRKLGSIRVATKYPNVTRDYYAKTGMQVEIVQLHGNIELAPLTDMAERIVDITATGTTLRENNLEIVGEVLSSTARFFANPCSLRTDERVIELANKLAEASRGAEFKPIAGKAM